MRTNNIGIRQFGLACLAAALPLTMSSCAPKTEQQPAAAAVSDVKVMPAGKEYSGLLSDYSKLKANPKYETAVSYVSEDAQKNIHKYVAIIVDPVQVYVATNADPKSIPENGRKALTEYFQTAVMNAVSDAYPVVQTPGPLVLRLRSALIGVDVGGENAGDKSFDHMVNIGKVGVEFELVDSETGAQIAAAVDRQNLGEGAVVGSANFSREEKFRAATEAFDGWASRLRQFLNTANELSPDDITRNMKSSRPYGTDKP
jgi:Protein of unknown function (DUF3313)